MSLSNIPISRKLVLAFAGILAVFGLAGALVFTSLTTLQSAADDKEHSLKAMVQVESMMADILDQQNAARAFAMLGTEGFLDDYQAGWSRFQASVVAFKEQSTSSEQRARVDSLAGQVRELRGKLDQVIALARNPSTRNEAAQRSGVKMLGDIRATIAALTDVQQKRVEMRISAEQEAAADARWAIGLGVAAATLLAIMLGWLLSRTIAAPVAQMTRVMKTLAGGENKVDVPASSRGDEIGDMARAVLVFREQAIEKEKLDAQKRTADAEQQLVVGTLETNLSKLAKGDLTSEITEAFSPAYEPVKRNFNAAVAELRVLIGTVRESAASIRTGSGEIAQASEDLARRTEANAASLEETSAAVTQMDGRLRATAASAGRTVARADDTIATVSGGRAIADDAMQAMTRVNESAKGIDNVIEGLDKIAFQTRVLAMNAAVEAGRAGEAGRGFAVVADLVSALAMRAEEEAGRARDQLTATQTDIVAAVEMVQKMDEALADITSDVTEVHTLLGEIAADNQAQSTAVTQISVAIGTMDHATQQNAAMVEETSAAARNLSTEVATLAEQASKFNVGEASTHAFRAQPPKPSAASASHRSPVKPLPASISPNARLDDWASF